MRLVSQDKQVDIPYETSYLFCDGNIISACVFEESNEFDIAEYSTNKKALKVMEMVRKQYADSKVLECFNTGMMHEYAKCNESQVMCVHNRIASTFIFQFPADEDVTI